MNAKIKEPKQTDKQKLLALFEALGIECEETSAGRTIEVVANFSDVIHFNFMHTGKFLNWDSY